MNVIRPLTDQRKRRPDGRVIEDGEAIGFNIALVRDAAPAGTATRFLTDADFDRAVRAEVDREQALHDHKFAFMGNIAPKFDRSQSEFLARQRLATDAQKAADNTRALAAARYQDAARDASAAGLNAWRGGHYAAEHETRVADAQSARASINALRSARYTGE
jgi:hypothetical protein